MDLIIGHVTSTGPLKEKAFPTCVFAGNYNEAIAAKQDFTNILGDKIQILAVFLGKGSQANRVQASLQKAVQCRNVGWFDGSPGELMDTVHFMLAPQSVVNTFLRSADNLIAPATVQSNACEEESPGAPEHAKPKAKPRTRAPKHGKLTDCA